MKVTKDYEVYTCLHSKNKRFLLGEDMDLKEGSIFSYNNEQYIVTGIRPMFKIVFVRRYIKKRKSFLDELYET